MPAKLFGAPMATATGGRRSRRRAAASISPGRKKLDFIRDRRKVAIFPAGSGLGCRRQGDGMIYDPQGSPAPLAIVSRDENLVLENFGPSVCARFPRQPCRRAKLRLQLVGSKPDRYRRAVQTRRGHRNLVWRSDLGRVSASWRGAAFSGRTGGMRGFCRRPRRSARAFARSQRPISRANSSFGLLSTKCRFVRSPASFP